MVGVLLACVRGDERTADTATSVVPPPVSATAAADTGCPKVGDWQRCSVEDRLTRAGLVIEARDTVRHAFLSVAGLSYSVGAGEDEVQVFVYPTAAARKADTDRLDSARVGPRGATAPRYRVPPLLVTSSNLAAIVFSLNDRTSERLSLALSAGLPPRAR
jgi:hypothetical protein